VRGKLIIHFLLSLSFKTAKCDSRIGWTKEPERPAPEAIPEPNGADGKIKNIKIPELPVCQFLKEFFYHMSEKQK
jgi:hypothetical protein